jgi:hypothetical protein
MSSSELAVIAFPSPKAVRFPAECAQCASPPSNGYLLVGERLAARVPLCPACDGRKTLGMALWVVGTTLGSILSVVVLALLLEIVLPIPEEHGPRTVVAMVIALILIAFGGGLFVLAAARTDAARARSCKGWIQEAALRMLHNNLDPEVAERPGRPRRLRRHG